MRVRDFHSLFLLAGVAALLSLGSPGSAHASDGRIEINQVNALAGGVTPGDTAGFPVTISAPGGYVLTSNLDVRVVSDAATVTAIQVTASGVEIDLNGFEIVGPTSCTGSPPQLDCEPYGGGRGIVGGPEITVRNGTIRGMGGDGIRLNGPARVEGIHARDNGGDGIFAGWHCVVVGNAAYRNGGDGIETGDNCTIARNATTQNDESGISTGGGCTVVHNTTNENDSGVLARGGSTLIGNTAYRNVSWGFNLNLIAGYGDNVLSTNNGNAFGSDTNPEVQGGVQIGTNLCGSDTVCP